MTGVAVTGFRAPGVDEVYHPAVEVYFSPNGGCTAAILRELDEAKQDVYVQAYSFTSKPIAEALVRDKQRGVQVQVILDHSQPTARGSMMKALKHAHIPVFIDKQHKIAHNKVMIVDGETIITGSFNFTAGAEHDNAENMLILHDTALAARYQGNWDAQKAICQ